MATMAREESDAETEEPNPFLSPPPPSLHSTTILAPALPPRDNGSSSRNSPGSNATPSSSGTFAPSSSSRIPRQSGTNGHGDGSTAAQTQGRHPPDQAPPPPYVPLASTTTAASRASSTRVVPEAHGTDSRASQSTTPEAATPAPAPAGGGRGGGGGGGGGGATCRRDDGGSGSSSSTASAFPLGETPPGGTTTSTTSSGRRRPSSNGGSSTTRTSTAAPAPAPASTPGARSGATHRRGSQSRSSGGGSSGGNGGNGLAARVSWASASPPATASSTATTTASGGTSTASSTSSTPGSARRGTSWNWGNLGRSLIGAVLGPNAVGGEDGGGGGQSDRALEARERVRFRELTPHEMQQTADGRFSVAVWRKHKQDDEPVKVAVGVYATAYEAQRAAECFSPPLWQEPAKDSRCSVCNSTFGYVLKRRHHCRNCGRLVCSSCAETFWPRSMLPPTYSVDTGEKKVRVCSTCHSAGEEFRKALLEGSEEGAMAAFSTGCINLRVPYSIYHNELPVHCAAAGGNLNILAWLVDDRCCPLFLDREKKVALGDSRRQSVMGAAAAGGHVQIMRYLAFTQGCKVTEIRDMKSLWGALEKCLYDGANVVPEAGACHTRRNSVSTSGGGSGGGGGSIGGGYPSSAPSGPAGGGGAEVAAPEGDDDNMCIVCFERKVDCTLVPCGHHCCCLTCAAQFDQCPVCRVDVQQKIRAISV